MKTKTIDEIEEACNDYVESCDNESGHFLSHQLERIRQKAWDAGREYQLKKQREEVQNERL